MKTAEDFIRDNEGIKLFAADGSAEEVIAYPPRTLLGIIQEAIHEGYYAGSQAGRKDMEKENARLRGVPVNIEEEIDKEKIQPG